MLMILEEIVKQKAMENAGLIGSSYVSMAIEILNKNHESFSMDEMGQIVINFYNEALKLDYSGRAAEIREEMKTYNLADVDNFIIEKINILKYGGAKNAVSHKMNEVSKLILSPFYLEIMRTPGNFLSNINEYLELVSSFNKSFRQFVDYLTINYKIAEQIMMPEQGIELANLN